MKDLKNLARKIFFETIQSIDIPSALARKLAREGSRLCVGDFRVDLNQFDGIYVVSLGKASVAMARGLRGVLAPEYSCEGIVIAPHATSEPVPGFRFIPAGHPLPDAGSFQAARAILNLLTTTDERSLVFFLLSGGGSALAELPLDPGVSLEDMRALNRQLITCGAPINEINAVRKHLSAIKGGRLAVAAPHAMKVTLGVSDVPAGYESALASGPTVPDPTTVADACDVIERHHLLGNLPPSIRAKFEEPGCIPETPKQPDPAFHRSIFQILLGQHELFHSAHRAAEAAGFVTACDNTTDEWPVARAGDYLLDALMLLKRANPGRSAAIIAGGELNSPASGTGVGGRNSALVLECVEKIAGQRIAVLSAGTDGVDGSSPAAGAVAEGTTLARARAEGLNPSDFARRCDSYTFFKLLGDAIETGPTGNNLRDLRILLAE